MSVDIHPVEVVPLSAQDPEIQTELLGASTQHKTATETLRVRGPQRSSQEVQLPPTLTDKTECHRLVLTPSTGESRWLTTVNNIIIVVIVFTGSHITE